MNLKRVALFVGVMCLGISLKAKPALASTYAVSGSTVSCSTCTYGVVPSSISVSTAAYVAQVAEAYVLILDRTADTAGLTYWVSTLISGANTIEQVRYYLAVAEVNLLYQTILHRDPDPAGLNYWVGTLVSGANTGASARYYIQQAAAHS